MATDITTTRLRNLSINGFLLVLMFKHTSSQHTPIAMHPIHAIYLRPVQNMQGGHELTDLTSGLVITQANVTEIPVTNLVLILSTRSYGFL